MLKIRLRRIGKKHQPFYRIVICEHTTSVKGSYLVKLGHYNPKTKEIVLNKEETLNWMNKGAKPSNTVAKLLKKEGVQHKSIVIKTFKTKSKQQIEAEKKEKELEKAKEDGKKAEAKIEFEVKKAEEAKKEENKESDATEGRSSSEKPEEKQEK